MTDSTSPKQQKGQFINGRIDEVRLKQITALQFNGFSFFICGPYGFIKNMQSILLDNNTDSYRIMTEQFAPTLKINDAIAVPGRNMARWIYGLAGSAILLSAGSIMFADMSHVLSKFQKTQTVNSQTGTGDNTLSPDSQSGAGNASNIGSTNPPTSTTNQSQTYQSPVTSVS